VASPEHKQRKKMKNKMVKLFAPLTPFSRFSFLHATSALSFSQKRTHDNVVK
jgi:hypothetical protein